MYATLTAEGTFEKHEGKPSLEQMQEFVAGPGQKARGESGMVELVQIAHGIDMWFNEEGKYECVTDEGVAIENKVATMFAQKEPGLFAGDWIAGDALFTGSDDDGETIGLTDEQMAYVEQAARIREIGRVGSGVWNMTGISL
jgi:Domain of unknown function (DUF3846)